MNQPLVPSSPGPPGPRGRSLAAWVIIVLLAALAMAPQFLDLEPAASDADDPIGLVLMRMQSQYMLGIAGLLGDAQKVYDRADALNVGTIGQRQRFVVLAGELAGAAEASQVLVAICELLESERSRGTDAAPELTARQSSVQQILRLLYPPHIDPDAEDAEAAQLERVAGLSSEQRSLLVAELEWFGDLALAPAGGDESGRQAVLGDARRVAFVMIGGVLLLGMAGLVGAAGLVAVSVAAYRGALSGGLDTARGHHGIYAETFAVWFSLFLGLQLAGGILAAWVGGPELLASLVGFMASLVALRWPVYRGIPWEDVCRDIGLTRGSSPLLEPLVGAAGYLMALPLVAVGIGLTLVLLLIQSALSSPESPFSASSGPAHPIVLELAGSGWGPKLTVLLLASVAAPLVEETMFRGVLYRHLRDSTARLGRPLSVLAAGSLNALLFAAIHPQGWIAIPALMSLAYSFVLLREWRGTLIPSMVAHGISNGIVMLLLISILSG